MITPRIWTLSEHHRLQVSLSISSVAPKTATCFVFVETLKRKVGPLPLLGLGVELLTWTGDNVERWKVHFSDLLYLYTFEEVDSE